MEEVTPPTLRFEPDRPAMFRDLRSRALLEALILAAIFGFLFGTTLGLSSSAFYRLLGLVLFIAVVAPLPAAVAVQISRLRGEVSSPLLLTSEGVVYDVRNVGLRAPGRLPWNEVGQVKLSEQWFDTRVGLKTVTFYHTTFRKNAAYATVQRGATKYIRVPFLRAADAEAVRQIAIERAVASREAARTIG